MAKSKSRSRSRSRGRTSRRRSPITPSRSVRSMSLSRSRSKGKIPVIITRPKRKFKRQRLSRFKYGMSGDNAGYKGSFGPTSKPSNEMYTYHTQGGVFVKETSGIVTTALTRPIACIGHATTPDQFLLKTTCLAIVKKMIYKMQLSVDSVETSIGALVLGDTFFIEYKPNYIDSLVASVSGAVGVSFPAQPSIGIIADWLETTISTLTNQTQLVRMTYVPGAANTLRPAFCNLSLKNARVQFMCKSVLVLQNRTLAEVGDEGADRVDNQPVVGKQYFGYGTGTQQRGPTSGKFEIVADGDLGTIAQTWGPENMREPPHMSTFVNVKQSGAAQLDPGSLKTSTLEYRKTMSLNSLINRVLPDQIAVVPNKYFKVGKFKFFLFEKQIDCVSEAPAVAIGFEHNLTMAAHLIVGVDKFTTQTYEKQYINQQNNS